MSEKDIVMNVSVKHFGEYQGQKVKLYSLVNDSGMQADIMTYGGILVNLLVPDRDGNCADITLGFKTFDEYLQDGVPYFGALVGRLANRLDQGKFQLDGQAYQLHTNNGAHHLHGGKVGFDKVIWIAEAIEQPQAVGVRLKYHSPAGEENFPGNLDCTVEYILNDKNELSITYHAQTDAATPVNLTQHSYYNLAGESSGNILGHELTLNADNYTPVDDTLIPTGQLAVVADTPLDFRKPKLIGAEISQVPGGYDHNFVLNEGNEGLNFAARLCEPASGRVMEVFTTEPGIQFYAGNFLDGTLLGKGGIAYQKQGGLCLETQHYPDSPNKPQFPSVILRPGQNYYHHTVHRFSRA